MDRLQEYAAKRNFRVTPEPPPGDAPDRGPLLFMLHRHRAQRDHFDLRIELDGALKSWAIPKGPSDNPEDKRFAAATEDHPFGYAGFEGVIPTGQYGAGEMLVWDVGTWFCDENAPLGDFYDPEFRRAHEEAALEQLKKGKLSLFFRGMRLKGSYTLVETKEGWLFIKHQDAWTRQQPGLGDLMTSALTGRTYEQVARHGTTVFPYEELLPVGSPETLPVGLSPMKAEAGERAFDSSDWFFEPKLDGIRALVICRGSEVVISTRQGRDTTFAFPELVEAFQKQQVHGIFDGEIVAFEQGRPSFSAMMSRFHLRDDAAIKAQVNAIPVVFFAFDLLHLNGQNLRQIPNLLRKRFLRQLLLPTPRLQYVEHLEDAGLTFFSAVVAAGFEGAMAKRKDGRYDPTGKRTTAWLKLKYTTSAEFVVGGYSKGEGNRASTFGAVYVGYYDQGELRYAGRVGTGFTEAELGRLSTMFQAETQKQNPFTGPVELEGPTVWVPPRHVMEVKFAEIMPSGHLRMPVYVRMRPDLDPAEVGPPSTVRPELPVDAPVSAPPLIQVVLDQLEGLGKQGILRVGSVELSITNLDKPLWPAVGDRPAWTKRDLLRYLTEVSPFLLPHFQDRPVTMIRYPDGIHGEKFFQKHHELGRPDFVRVQQFWSDTHKKNQDYLLVDDLATLLWMGQIGTLEFHVPAGRIVPGPDGEGIPLTFTDSEENVKNSLFNYPDFIRFDLDPYVYSGQEKEGEEPELNPAAFEKTKTVAFRLREILAPFNLPLFAKTTGKTGLHLFIPIVRNLDTQGAKAICATFCQALERAFPRDVTTEWTVSKRTGKVFLDYNMNAMGKTLGAAYSPRALENQGVSLPLTWEELENAYPSDFTMATVPALLKKRGDVWAEILDKKVDLTKIL